MNIIKETLETTKDELVRQIALQERANDEHLKNTAQNIVINIDDLFKEFTVTSVSSNRIMFKFTEDSWYDFEIYRSERYINDEYKYDKAYLSVSSSSSNNDKALKKLICVGILSRHCLYETSEWNELVSLMNESSKLCDSTLKHLYKQKYQIDNELNRIEQEEKNSTLETIFSKGTFKLSEKIFFYYGSGKWDRVSSDEFFWEANESGKTYTVSYTDKVRTNPYYDAEDNYLEPIFELRKQTINKRIRKADIESFVKYNMRLILIEDIAE